MSTLSPTPAQDPTPAAAADLVRRFYAAFGSGDVAALDGVFDAAWTDHTLPPGRGPGREGLKAAVTVLRRAVPDLSCRVEDIVAAGDRVAVRITFAGTHTGPFGDAPPTGDRVEFIAFDLHRTGGGRIVESWHLEDNLTALQQLGVLPGARG